MKVYDLHDEDGQLYAFEIDNSTIARSAVVKIVESIPGAVVTRRPKLFRFGEEEFCDFELKGGTFKAWEPWGDSSRFWIGPATEKTPREIIVDVRKAFVRFGTPSWVQPFRVLSLLMVGFGLPAFLLLKNTDSSLVDLSFWAFLAGGILLAVLLIISRNFPAPHESAG